MAVITHLLIYTHIIIMFAQIRVQKERKHIYFLLSYGDFVQVYKRRERCLNTYTFFSRGQLWLLHTLFNCHLPTTCIKHRHKNIKNPCTCNNFKICSNLFLGDKHRKGFYPFFLWIFRKCEEQKKFLN